MTRSHPRRCSAPLPLFGVTVALVWVGCGAEAAGTGAAGARGLDGPDAAIDPQTEDVYTVGALEGDDWETFGNVTSVEFDRDGTLYILDSDAAHIVVISRAGEHVRTISRKGDGPGELASPMGLAVLPDGRLVVFDLAKQGFQVFGTDGEFIQAVQLSPDTGFPGSRLEASPDGALISIGGLRISMGSEGHAESPPGRPIDRFGLDGSREVAYLAWQPPPPDLDDADLSSGGGQVRFSMPKLRAFEPRLHADVLPDGRLAVVDSVDYRVKLVDGGVAAGALERPIAPVPVGDEIMRLERERQLEQLSEGSGGGGVRVVALDRRGGSGGGNVSFGGDAVRQMMLDRVEGMVFAEEIPVISQLKVDWEGRIWVARSGGLPGEPGPTDIITPDRAYLGTIAADGLRIPAAFGPDGLIAYIESDELEVERVRVARLDTSEVLEEGR